MTPVDVSIVIPVFNKSEMTRVCLNALKRTVPSDLRCEVIVIDNNSTDDTQTVLKEFPWVNAVLNERNAGYAAANNQGAALASGRYLLLLNNDTEPQPGWLRALLRAASVENVGVTGARLLFADGTLQHAGVVVGQERFGSYPYTPYHYLWSDIGERPAAMTQMDYQAVTGACLMTPLSLFRELGGLDELFWNGYEDIDYCFKVLAHGMRVVYEPQAKVFHFESQSGPMRFSRHAYNSTLLMQRWSAFPKIDHVQNYLRAGNIRRTNRVSNKFATVSMRAPAATIIVHGDGDPAPDFVRRLRETLAPVAKIIWTPTAPPPSFGNIVVEHRPGNAVQTARSEMDVRGDRYLVFVDVTAELNKGWLDKLCEQLEFGVDVVAATCAPFESKREQTLIAADARCTVLSLRLIPQNIVLGEFGTLNGAIADLTLRLMAYELAVRAAAEPVVSVREAEADIVFEHQRGAPVQAFLREDTDYIERVLRGRSRRDVMELKASIVMLSWNAPQFTKIALESIRAHTKMPHEIIIVDNGSGEETTSWLRAQEGITVIYNATNRGFAGGNNQGIAAATGDYVVLLNNDVVVTDGWLENLVDAVERDPATGMSAPRSNEVAGDQKLLNLNYDSLEKMAAIAAQRSVDFRRAGYFTDRAIGFCLCIDRKVIDQVGGIDESFGTGNFEDDDFSMRVRAAGFKIFVCNDVFIHHFGSVSFKANAVDYAATMRRNWEIFASKWGYGREFPVTGYDCSIAISKGFDRSAQYVALPLSTTQQAAPENHCRVLFGAVVSTEADWTGAAKLVRNYLDAFSVDDSVMFAVACRGAISADTIGNRIAKMIEKTGVAPEQAPDVVVSDEDSPLQWFTTFEADRCVAAGPAPDGFQELDGKSPSALRRLYQRPEEAART